MVSSEEFFKQDKYNFLKDDSSIFMEKDYASIFYKSLENSPKNSMKFLDEENIWDLKNQKIDFDLNFYTLENFDSLRAIKHIKILYYKKEFEEILKFVSEYFPNVNKFFLNYFLFFYFL